MTDPYRAALHDVIEEELEEAKLALAIAEEQIKMLHQQIAVMNGGLHPYNKTFHEKKMCPVCNVENWHKGRHLVQGVEKEYLYFVTVKKVDRQTFWFKDDIPEHLLIHCQTCGCHYPMQVPPEWFEESLKSPAAEKTTQTAKPVK